VAYRALSQENQGLKTVCSQLSREYHALKMVSSQQERIDKAKDQLHQHEPRIPPCPGCGREDPPPPFIIRHRQSGQCLSVSGFKVLYVWTILDRTCGVEDDVARRLLLFDQAYRESNRYELEEALHILSVNGLEISAMSTVGWVRWLGTLPKLIDICHRLDTFYAVASWSKYPLALVPDR
jgi:hypothetical protein